MEQTLFYILAAVTVIATIFAISEKHPVHAIVYLVTSFFSLAVIFYLLAAPLIAMFEVIIYAGAVMVLFMFVIMMLDLGQPGGRGTSPPDPLSAGPAVGRNHPGLAGAADLKPFSRRSGHPAHREREGVCRNPLWQVRGRHRDHFHAIALCRGRRAVSGKEAQAMIVPLMHLLIFASILFALGLICVLIWRSNVIMLLIGIEIMLNAAMLVFVAGSQLLGRGRWADLCPDDHGDDLGRGLSGLGHGRLSAQAEENGECR